jgi:Uma2 family endonuclease
MATLLEADEEVRGLDLLSPDALYEVVDGEAKELPPKGAKAGLVASELVIRMGAARPHPRDIVIGETLFALPAPVNRRRPDVAYIPASRVPANWPPPADIDPPAIHGVPAIAVEVVSPTDFIGELEDKRLEYFAVGVERLLVVFPNHRTIHVHESGSLVRILTEADTLELGTVLPGFSVRVSDLFAPLNPPS